MTVSAGQPAREDQPVNDSGEGSPPTIFTAHRRTQALVSIASILCIVMFWEGAATLGIPPVPRFNASLLAQSGPFTAVLATYVMFAVAVAVGTLIAGRSWFFSGIFTGAVGLVTLSVRGGPMHYVLFDAAAQGDTHRVFLRLLTEQCLVFLPVAVAWPFFWRRYEAALPRPDLKPPAREPSHLGATTGAVLSQIIIMGLIVWLLAPTDVKKQVVVGVFVGGFAGAALGEYLFPNRKAAGWYWLAPFIVGAAGYIAAYLTAPDATTGSAIGSLANLAHPVPLDYAGAGIAGSLIGFWISEERLPIQFSFRKRSPSPATNVVGQA